MFVTYREEGWLLLKSKKKSFVGEVRKFPSDIQGGRDAILVGRDTDTEGMVVVLCALCLDPGTRSMRLSDSDVSYCIDSPTTGP